MQIKSIPEDFVVVEIAHHTVQETGEYALCEMTKRNLTTERALSTVADTLKIPRRFLGYAGTKDARAITRQYITIKTERPDILNTSQRIQKDNLSLRFLGFVQEPLSLGNLEKNRFEIVVRKITDEKIHILTAIPNYFDEQRFSTANAQIGKLILQKMFLDAAHLVIQTDPDAAQRMKDHLAEKPNDAITALRLIPKNILLLYVHAYQSLLFNEVLSEYIKQNDNEAIFADGPVPLLIPTKEIKNVRIPIFGFGTEHDEIFGKLYEIILNREGLTSRDFVVKSLPFLTVEGGFRDAFFIVEEITCDALDEDDLFPNNKKQKLCFTLPKSCYATMVVKCLYHVGRINGDGQQIKTETI